MKLYVWRLCVQYDLGWQTFWAFAVAHSREEAEQKVLESSDRESNETYGVAFLLKQYTPKEYTLDEAIGGYVSYIDGAD